MTKQITDYAILHETTPVTPCKHDKTHGECQHWITRPGIPLTPEVYEAAAEYVRSKGHKLLDYGRPAWQYGSRQVSAAGIKNKWTYLEVLVTTPY